MRLPERIRSSNLPKAEVFAVGEAVRTVVALPGIPVGSVGRVREIGYPFLAIEFEDGRVGYYSPRQLRRLPAHELAPPREV